MMRLISINRDGTLAGKVANPPAILADVLEGTAAMYRSTGYEAPWIGYVALDDGQCVGTCAFKSSPLVNRVEIAYFTFPGHERRGVGTRMAKSLVDIARRDRPGLIVTAQTMPEDNASTAILKKLGFVKDGVVEHPEDGPVWEWVLKQAGRPNA